MKKLVGLFVALFVCTLFVAPVLADVFESSTTKARITVSGTGSVEFSVKLYEWENTYEVRNQKDTIEWRAEDLNSLIMGKSVAQSIFAGVYAVVSSTITDPTAKVYVFQDNHTEQTGATTDFVAISSRSSGTDWVYNGLVNKSTKKSDTILGYKCLKLSDAKAHITNFPDSSKVDWDHDTRIFIDKKDSNWNTKKSTDDVIIAKPSGIFSGFYGGNDFANSTEDAVLLFLAEFLEPIFYGNEYGTDAIIFKVSIDE